MRETYYENGEQIFDKGQMKLWKWWKLKSVVQEISKN